MTATYPESRLAIGAWKNCIQEHLENGFDIKTLTIIVMTAAAEEDWAAPWRAALSAAMREIASDADSDDLAAKGMTNFYTAVEQFKKFLPAPPENLYSLIGAEGEADGGS